MILFKVYRYNRCSVLIFNKKLRSYKREWNKTTLFLIGGIYMNYWGMFFSFIFIPAIVVGTLIITYKIERRDNDGKNSTK